MDSLTDEQTQQLLSLLADRLQTGEVLVGESHLLGALQKDYLELTQQQPTPEVVKRLTAALRSANEASPEVFLVPGLENWIAKSVLIEVRKQGFGIVEVQERGNHAVREFVREKKVQSVLEQLGLLPNQLNLRRCLRTIVNTVAGKVDPQQQQSAARLAQMKAAAATRAAADPAAAERPAAAALRPSGEQFTRWLSTPVGLPTEEEAEQRAQEQRRIRAGIRKAQMANLVKNLDAYVQQGKLTAKDAERLSKLQKVDAAVDAGKVSAEKGSKIRNSVLAGTARSALDKKVKDAVDQGVVYLQVFEALKRIDSRFDAAMRYLIRHKKAVNADRTDEGKPPDLREASTDLIEDIDCLHCLIDLMDRQDAEARMIAARLPPYSHIIRRDQDRVERLVIEDSFVDDLRNASDDDISGRLNSAEPRTRARVAADMVCMTVLLNRIIKPTPIRKELRLLKINLIIEEFYRSSDDIESARGQAQEFLCSRLKTLYTDLTAEETEEIQRRGEEMIEAVEQKIVAERKEAATKAEDKGKEERGAADADDEDEPTLTSEEEQKGVQIHRVAVRVAGRIRQIPYKIMPDEDDASKFIIVRKDPESGEMVAVRRRGSKRYVQQARDGSWVLG